MKFTPPRWKGSDGRIPQAPGANYSGAGRVARIRPQPLDGHGRPLLPRQGPLGVRHRLQPRRGELRRRSTGAVKVHGCDIYERRGQTAREMFADLRHVESRFEVST
jgi:hypothetical protein